MVSIGDRLREERDALGCSQEELAAVAGITKKTQGLYERNERSPSAKYLADLSARGVDVLYVVTGERKPQPADSLSAEDAEMLDRFRLLPPEDRAGMIKIITAMSVMADHFQFGKR